LPPFLISFDGCHFHQEYTGVHKKPETTHVMEDGGTERFEFWSRG
jgi:hypothetical protein